MSRTNRVVYGGVYAWGAVMGIKKRYILQVGKVFYTGPKAYYYLLDVYERQYRAGSFVVKAETLVQKYVSWRRKIKPLHDALKPVSLQAGTLQTFSGRNPRTTPLYKALMAWMDHNHPRPKPLRTEEGM